MTADELHRIAPRMPLGVIATFVDVLNDAMAEFEINTPRRQAAFIAQVLHESGGFIYVHEIASGHAYDHRADLGNCRPEAIAAASEYGSTAGAFWRGHGLIQITGYDNHRSCGEALGLDLVNHPELLEEPSNSCRSAAWFWQTHGLNDLADERQFTHITEIINGGHNGLADREMYYYRALTVLVT